MKLPFNVDLTGKVAVVTGAGGILCSDFSRAIAQCGASVALLDINVEAAEAVAKEIRDNGGKAEIVFPAINPDELDNNYLYTIKLSK